MKKEGTIERKSMCVRACVRAACESAAQCREKQRGSLKNTHCLVNYVNSAFTKTADDFSLYTNFVFLFLNWSTQTGSVQCHFMPVLKSTC